MVIAYVLEDELRMQAYKIGLKEHLILRFYLENFCTFCDFLDSNAIFGLFEIFMRIYPVFNKKLVIFYELTFK